MTDESINNIISPDDLRRRLTASAPLTVIDVLPDTRFAAGHVPGAKNACVYEVVFTSAVAKIQPDRKAPLVVYGHSAETMDAAVAAKKLDRAGYQSVYLLDGGFAAWLAAGYPIEKNHGADGAPPIPVLPPPDGRYAVSTDDSSIEWTGRNNNGKHFGRVRLASGTVDLSGGRFTGDFKIDMASIVNTDLAGDTYYQVLIDHLMSDDFFFVERFPSAQFHLTQMTPLGKGRLGASNYQVAGTFELVGVALDLTFPAVVAPMEDGTVVVSAHFDIDRTKWGIIYGADRFFAHLGKHLVYDIVSIELRLVAARSAGG